MRNFIWIHRSSGAVLILRKETLNSALAWFRTIQETPQEWNVAVYQEVYEE